ncbi:NnrS family protein [Metapseudomonas lalkuanensis]|uniref:NnrS family protein n=1 Tax=Metapseudomonas lalkuanensis TaxID=2604832 RepID=A0A5J6QMM7_9GAMM|nr:NnrS family protein [Pseudomonas lalkuanensis]QEY63703.1 NnrS family protein [Pseudomonas lalkuanensis]
MQLLDASRDLAIRPIWRLGFRPFFLFGTAFALVAVLIWLAALDGHAAWQPAGGWLAWHRHEMVFGFGGAIIAGFLLTAVQNWTGNPGLRGRSLALLATFWLTARVAWLMGAPLAMVIPLELAFLPAVAFVMGRSLWRVRQRGNYPVVVVLSLLAAADALVLWGLAVGGDAVQRQGVLAALWLVAALMGLIGGRVIPFFTQRGLGRAQQVKAWPWLDWGILAGGVLLAASFATGLGLQPKSWLAGLCLLLGLGNLLRLTRWYDAGIWQVTLLWPLHLAFAWLAVAPLGLAAWHLGFLANPSLAQHALGVGAMGGLILAMIARVSLGHSGRPLEPPRAMRGAFVLINLGAAARVLLLPIAGNTALWLAAICWAAAFALFLRHYAVLLCTPRVDGRPG